MEVKASRPKWCSAQWHAIPIPGCPPSTEAGTALAGDIHHPIQHKLGTVRNLMHRVDNLILDEERRRIEKEKVRGVLMICGYSKWGLKDGQLRGKRELRKEEEAIQKGSDQVEDRKDKQYVLLPYIPGVTGRIQRLFMEMRHYLPVCQSTLHSQKCYGEPQESSRD